MSAISTSPGTTVEPAPGTVAADLGTGLQVVARGDPRRAGLERFVARSFARAYDAHIEHFAEMLVGVADAQGAWSAGVGYTPAGSTPLFVEQYLDVPIEQAIAARLGVRIERSQIVEVGNLAACVPGAARRLIVRMTGMLHRLGHTWVVFTSTRALLNAFARLDLAPIVLACADPSRLADGADRWGTYYDTSPLVMTSNIPLGFIHFLSKRADARRG